MPGSSRDDIVNKIIGLGEKSHKKSYYPQLVDQLEEIKRQKQALQQKNEELERTLSELSIAKEKAEESDRLKSAFLANMSHEIRTPMNGILGFMKLLMKEDISQTEREKYSDIVEASSNRLMNTINDLIDISRIEAGQEKVTESDVSLFNLCSEMLMLFQDDARKNGNILEYIPFSGLTDDKVTTDSGKLYSILSNLLKNAIKYTTNGKVTFGYRVVNDFVEFFVKDNGKGIPDDRIYAIFNRFEQADIEDRDAMEGSGLGLAISKAYVEMLGGSIRVMSKLNEGSEFLFTIPYRNENKNLINRINDMSINNEKKNPENLNFLIAEDDDVSRMYLEAILCDLNGSIRFASNGKDAVAMCRENSDIDLIFMDIKLPVMNGYEATREIREFNKDVVIIAQTAYALVGDREKALAAGCNDYISKPIQPEELMAVVGRYF